MASEKDRGTFGARLTLKERESEAEFARARSEAVFIEERARKEAFEILARAEETRRKPAKKTADRELSQSGGKRNF